MKIVMLDTNVLIDLANKRKAALLRLEDFIDSSFAISHLVYIEFMAGTQIRRKRVLVNFYGNLRS